VARRALTARGAPVIACAIQFQPPEGPLPYARVSDVNIYYERHGTGQPLLWIGGLGANLREIAYLIDAYSRHFEFIAFEARGCGRSDTPEGDYSIAGLADDAAGLLDELGVEAAFVYGSSMGGMVAQELVLRHERRVRALILGCTTAGAIRGVQPTPETIQRMIANQSLSGDEALEAGWRLGYSEAYIEANREALLELARAAAELAAPRDSYMRQVLAAARHDTYDRLDRVACPVMIVHGTDDVMVPAGNARLLKERIPHAELHVLQGLGHGYNLEGQAIADELVIGFLRRHARGEEAARAVR
jgi:pimeloyl-ACP methyl ester carboxylesterase